MPFSPGECEPRPPDDAFLDEAGIAAWFAARGTKPPKLPPDATPGACFVLPAEKNAEEALACSSTRIEQRGGSRLTGFATYRRVDRVRVFVVRGERVTKLLDAPLLFDVMDKEDLDEGPLFSLRVTRDDKGNPVVQEASPGACDRARAHNAEHRAAAGEDVGQQRWASFDRGILERLCKAAGKGLPSPMLGSPVNRSSL